MSRDRLHFTTFGLPTQPPLILLHGFLGNGQDFTGVISHLQKQFYGICVDLPGHGQSRFAQDYSMNYTAMLILDILMALKLTQTSLIGYSMGGRLALYLALHFPLQFPQVMLESASPGLATEAARLTRRQQDEALADRLEADFALFLHDWYAQPLWRSRQQQPDFAIMPQQRLQNDPAELAKSLRHMGLGRQPNLWPALAHHQQPLLLLVGEDDRKFVAINQAMSHQCSTANLKVIPQVGHNIHLEQPLAWSMAVCQFLEQTYSG